MILWLKKIWRWLAALVGWVWSPRWVWRSLGAIVVVFIICSAFPSVEQRVRYAGLLFQLLGLAAVAKGLRETRRLFNRPGLATLAAEWWHQFPSFTPKTYVLKAQADSIRIAGNEVALVRGAPAQALSIEERIALLE